VNAIQKARNAYSTEAQAIKTPRSTEYDAFARVTQALRSATAQGQAGFPALAGAIHHNRSLWTMLAADVADSGNGLTPDLRARIIYLAEFTSQHSSKVLGSGASAEPLIEINTAVMAGLRDQAPGR
jgi:flagellar protein FlaF